MAPSFDYEGQDAHGLQPGTSDFSTNFTAAHLREQLSALLEFKTQQIHSVGRLGQIILGQQTELEERIIHLDEVEKAASGYRDHDTSPEVAEKLAELSKAAEDWDNETADIWKAVAVGARPVNGVADAPGSPSFSHEELLSHESFNENVSMSTNGPTATQLSRRQRNAAPRTNNVEFATEIGSQLIQEVRRLGSLLSERDKAVQDMKEEKDDMEKSLDTLRSALRQQEIGTDKYKEENWNLEVQLQELRSQLEEAKASTLRAEAEQKRSVKQLAIAQKKAEEHKDKSDELQVTVEDLRLKHETDVAQMRKTAATLQRDKSDLQSSLETLKTEVAKKSRVLPRSPVTPSDFIGTPNQEDEDVFTGGGSRRKFDNSAMISSSDPYDFDASPDPSPSKPGIVLTPSHPSNEIEALRQSLAHANRQMSTLRNSVQREKELKMEYRRKLAQEGQSWDDEEVINETSPEPIPRARLATPSRGGRGRGGRGRGGAQLTLAQKLGIAATERALDSPGSPYAHGDYRDAAAASQEQDDLLELYQNEEDPSPFIDKESNRPTSIDGMDPAYANVLRSLPSQEFRPVPDSPSPLASRNGTFGRRARGGAAFKSEPRPTSIIDAPSALSAELAQEGNDFDGLMRDDTEQFNLTMIPTLPPRKVETSDMGIQCDPEPVPIVVPPPKVETSNAGVQSDPEPVSVLPSPVQTSEVSVQSDPELAPPAPVLPPPPPPVQTFDANIQSDPEPVIVIPIPQPPPKPETADTGIQSDPIPEPQPIYLPAPVTLSPPPPPPVETAEMAIQSELEQVPVPAPVLAPMPLPLPVSTPTSRRPQLSEAALQTDALPAPPSMADMGVSTNPWPLMISNGMSTDPEPVKTSSNSSSQTTTPILANSGTQTPRVQTREIEVQVDYVPSTVPSQSVPVIVIPEDEALSRPSTISSSSDIAMPRLSIFGRRSPTTRPVAMLFEDDSGRSGGETETETDLEYEDARETDVSNTPSASIQDFHSFRTSSIASSAEGIVSESDNDSISTRIGPRPSRSRLARSRYDSQATTHAPEHIVLPAPPPKPEVKEISVQTDEWTPPAPPPVVASPSMNFHRIGGALSNPFQYIPPSPAKPPSAALAAAANIVRTPMRDSTGTFGNVHRVRTPSISSNGDRRPSIDSAYSRTNEEVSASPRGKGIALPTMVDKTRPPTMKLPPPPSMPPPAIIPVKKSSNPPPRPTSPPPAELIQRATTPTFGRQNSLMVPSVRGVRQHGQSLPPSNALRQPPSTSSFRSAMNAASRAMGGDGFDSNDRRDHLASQTSLLSAASSAPSRRPSVTSSRSSEPRTSNVLGTPQTPSNMSNPSTDPAVIHAITQTMIGEFLYKYTRKVVGRGYGEKRHKRFFWVHPYTKTLYWSSADPGASNASESNAKSAYIDSVKSVLDPNPLPPGLHQYSIIISTPQREMKITAPTKERHDIWFRALSYLLDRPSTVPMSSPAGGSIPPSPMPSTSRRGPSTPAEDSMLRREMMASPQSVRSARSNRSIDSWNLTPRARAAGAGGHPPHLTPGSLGRRGGTPADEYMRSYAYADQHSPTKSLQQRFEAAMDDHDDDDDDGFETVDRGTGNSGEFEVHDDEGYEGLENVRACCDGEHDLNHLSKGPGHHHHHHPRPSSRMDRPPSRTDNRPSSRLDNRPSSRLENRPSSRLENRPSSRLENRPSSRMDNIPSSSRPVSPSAWSFRSRTGSQHSDGGSLFSWGGGGANDGSGKRSLRFGSKRSIKTSLTLQEQQQQQTQGMPR